MSGIKSYVDAYADAQSFIDAAKHIRGMASDFVINTDTSIDINATTKVKECDTKTNKDLSMLI